MPRINTQQERLSDSLRERVRKVSEEWDAGAKMQRFWDGDESLWTSTGEGNWLGWLRVVEPQPMRTAQLRDFREHVRGRYSHAVLLGMGGSSLCPEVLRLCFGVSEGFPDLKVVDSTDPAQIQACEDSIRIETTLFLSASKSGSTIETSLLTQHFLDRSTRRIGALRAARQFVAITDPGSRLEAIARDLGFGRVFYGVPSIGGRYSALSNFGLVPAAALGLDVDRLLDGARDMHAACGPERPVIDNPGLRLGLLLGTAALAGRDKLTLLTSPGVASLGTWIEQLVAESTGKHGKGIVPIEGERLGEPSCYGNDRLFVRTSLESELGRSEDSRLEELSGRGHPVVRIRMQQLEDIGQEFFRWEIATAVAGAVLGINPFDQPDVESAKVAARELTAAYEADGSLPAEDAFLEQSGIQLFAPRRLAESLLAASANPTVSSVLSSYLDRVRAGDYLALLPFVSREPQTEAALARMRSLVQRRARVATCVGFGPRFLHSTGQLHKGGPDSGVFVQIGCDDAADIPAPGRGLSFGVVKAAQALGDFNVLARLGRRALRVHISGNLSDGLAKIEAAFAEAAQ